MIVRNNPWHILNELNSVLDGASSRFVTQDDTSVESGDWVPDVDIRDEDDKFKLQVDIPGVKPEEVEISMENNVLTVKGAREEEHQEAKSSYYRAERAKGVFYRRFTLPETADAENITATSKHGVLELSIMKKKAVHARKITITTDDQE